MMKMQLKDDSKYLVEHIENKSSIRCGRWGDKKFKSVGFQLEKKLVNIYLTFEKENVTRIKY